MRKRVFFDNLLSTGQRDYFPMSQAPPIVATLIDRFERNRDAYKSQGYNETQVRREFLDPFFEALGWDVANKQGHAEAYKDVIHEDAISNLSIPFGVRAGQYRYRLIYQYMGKVPIRVIDFTSKADKERHGRMLTLVEGMLNFHQRLTEAKTPTDKDRLQRQIDSTDQEIDRLVYDRYGLTEGEIKIVEGALVASSSKVKENDSHESDTQRTDRPGASRVASATVAQAAQYPGEGSGGASESPAGAGEPVHGVRESAGQYGSPQDPDGNSKGQSELGSTREFDTAEGRLSYSELSERLAVPLVGIYDEILQAKPDQIVINSEWLCVRHKRLAQPFIPRLGGALP